MTHGSERKRLGERGFESCGSGQGQMVSSCERGNERSSSVKFTEFLE